MAELLDDWTEPLERHRYQEQVRVNAAKAAALHPLIVRTEGKIAEKDESPIQPHIWRQFQAWLSKNRDIYRMFTQITFEKYEIDNGRGRHGSISLITELVRDRVDYVEQREEEFKLSNNLRSCIARKLMDDHPRLRGYFVTHSSVGRGRTRGYND